MKRNSFSGEIFCRGIYINLLGAWDEGAAFAFSTKQEALLSARAIRAQSFAAWKEENTSYPAVAALVEELSACVPSTETGDAAPLCAQFLAWLAKRAKWEKRIFLRRYFAGEPTRMLSLTHNMPKERMEKSLADLRADLCAFLTKKGVGAPAGGEVLFLALNDVADDALLSSQKAQKIFFGPRLKPIVISLCVVLALCLAVPVAHVYLDPNQRYFENCVRNWNIPVDTEISVHDLSRTMGWQRTKLTDMGAIPPMEDYQSFQGYAYYHDDESLNRVVLSWEHLSYMGLNYRKIRVAITPSPDGAPSSLVRLPLDETGQPIENTVTVTERDGVTIYATAAGRASWKRSAYTEKNARRFVFYKDGAWFEIEGQKADPVYMVEVLDWYLANDIPFKWFAYPD